MDQAEKLARIFQALAAESRLRIVQLLKGRALCVNALAERLGVSAAAVSQHLRILRHADLVVGQKRGYYVHYRINEATLRRWKKMTDGLLTIGGKELPACRRTKGAGNHG